MIRLLTLTVALAACSTQDSSEFHRGTYLQPPAPTRPGVGAPMYGTPNPAMHAPRSEHKRILPETTETRKEDGIWASTPSTDAVPLILGVPYPEEPTEGTMSAYVPCANRMNRAIDAADERKRAEALLPAEKQCLAARLYLECASRAPVDASALAVAKNHARHQCDGVNTTGIDAIARNVINEWRTRIDELNARTKRLR